MSKTNRLVCRVCLHTIAEDVLNYELHHSQHLVKKLDVLCTDLVKNLYLSEYPLICGTCVSKITELTNFKEAIIENEFKIKSNEKAGVPLTDVESMCRLCLSVKQEGELPIKWQEKLHMFSECDIRMNTDIAQPLKMCDKCLTHLESLSGFVIKTSNYEKLISGLFRKRGILGPEDLLGILKAKVEDAETEETSENNHQIPWKEENEAHQNNRGESAALDKSQFWKEEQNVAEENGNVNNQICVNESEVADTTLTPKENSTDANGQTLTQAVSRDISNPSDTNVRDIDNDTTENCLNQDLLTVSKTRKTYKKRGTNSLSGPSTSAQLPLSTLTNGKFILEKMEETLKKACGSIDVAPIQNLADITLDTSTKGIVQEPPTEKNSTIELIDVLEGRLGDNSYNITLNPPECGTIESEIEAMRFVSEDQVHAMPQLEPEAGTSQIELETKETNVKTEPEVCQETADITIQIECQPRKRGRPRKVPVAANKKVNIIKIVKIPTNQSSKDKVDEGQPPVKHPRQSLRQKSIMEAFNDMQDKTIISERPSNVEIEEASTSTSVEKMEKKNGEPLTKISIVRRSKRGEAKKQGLSESSNQLSDSDDSSDDGLEKALDSKPVTIIKSKKRTNKAELDKTWQQLTGKPVASGSGSISNAPATSTTGEAPAVKKKRGRRPLSPGSKKKPPRRKDLTWYHCNLCSFKTYAYNSYVQHQLIHNVMSNLPMLSCDKCRFTTTNQELMQQHKVSHESNDLTFKCLFCDRVFRKKVSCMYHTLRHDDQDVASQFYCMVYNPTTAEEYFECFQCDYQNVEESGMPDHVIDHTVERPKNPLVAKFKCSHCLYRTKSADLLKRHKMLHQEDHKKKMRAKKGQHSPIKEESDDEIVEEDRVVDDRPVLKCDQCFYVTRNKRSLSNHKGLKHKRLVFPSDAGAEAAAKAVQEGKPMYYCNECSYSTHRKLNLPRHALIHKTKENMEFYECTHCIFETKHRRSYTRHMEAIHGVIV